jgi:hypothetical protein
LNEGTSSVIQFGEVEVFVLKRLKLYDWTFSATAETVVGALLAIAIVVSTLG